MRKLLNDLTSNGDWESHGKQIQSRGGVFVGTAKTPEDAKIMAAGPKLLEYLESQFGDNEDVKNAVKEILDAVLL